MEERRTSTRQFAQGWNLGIRSRLRSTRQRSGRSNPIIRLLQHENKKLKTFANVIVETYGRSDKNLFAYDLPELRTRLLDIYGIGEETADDIILYAAKNQAT